MMTMEAYLREIEYAVRLLLPAMWQERSELARLQASIGKLTQQAEHGYREAARLMF